MRRTVIILSLLAVLGPSIPARAAVPSAERSAFVSFYNATGGPRWANRAGWLGKRGTECSWFGVQCNAERTAVIGLSLSDNDLAGSLPASLGNLANLQILELGLNQISGPLPAGLGNLTQLEGLSLPFNRISGSLPPELGRLASLQVLDLSHNEISGTLPPQLGDLQNLEFLDLSDNRLAGAIPAELGRLTRLAALILGTNQLSGRIPSALGSLTDLMFLDLQENQLAGNIPPELGNATSLLGLILSSNRLGGSIPGSFVNLTNLETLWLDHNRFTGPVPFALGALPTLSDDGGLDLRFNALATDTEPGLLADLNAKQAGGNWTASQAPAAPFDPEFPFNGLADRRKGGFVYWTLETGAGPPPLTVSTVPGTGDADLYVRFGAPPTLAEHDAVSAGSGSQESVTIASPRQGTYYIGLHAKSPYSGAGLRIAGLSGCVADATTLCLGNGRFKVQASWRTQTDNGVAKVVRLTADTGYLWFFDATNVEVVLKVLDACIVNGKQWVYAGGLTDVQVDITVTDTVTKRTKTYRNPLGAPFQPIQDSDAFEACGGGGSAAVVAEDVAALAEQTAAELERIAEASGNCVAGPTSLCLSGGRFRVEVIWKLPDGRTDAGRAVPLTPDTGYFWFFHETNVEMVIKVLNACSYNSRFWVYAGGLTDVETVILVTDTMTGAEKTYRNPHGTAFRPIQDSSAFLTCP